MMIAESKWRRVNRDGELEAVVFILVIMHAVYLLHQNQPARLHRFVWIAGTPTINPQLQGYRDASGRKTMAKYEELLSCALPP